MGAALSSAQYVAYPYAGYPYAYGYAGVPFGSSTGLDPLTQGLDPVTQGVITKREADPQVLTYGAYPYTYAAYPYAHAYVPFGSSSGLDPITQGLDPVTQGHVVKREADADAYYPYHYAYGCSLWLQLWSGPHHPGSGPRHSGILAIWIWILWTLLSQPTTDVVPLTYSVMLEMLFKITC